MKLGKVQNKIVKHGEYNSPEAELIYPSNICPECGYDITENDKKYYHEYEVEKQKLFRTYYGIEVEFKCPDCGCVFARSIYTEYEPKEFYKPAAVLIIAFLITLLLWALFCISSSIPGKLSQILLILSIISAGILINLFAFYADQHK